jgi:hypothetical protein
MSISFGTRDHAKRDVNSTYVGFLHLKSLPDSKDKFMSITHSVPDGMKVMWYLHGEREAVSYKDLKFLMKNEYRQWKHVYKQNLIQELPPEEKVKKLKQGSITYDYIARRIVDVEELDDMSGFDPDDPTNMTPLGATKYKILTDNIDESLNRLETMGYSR